MAKGDTTNSKTSKQVNYQKSLMDLIAEAERTCDKSLSSDQTQTRMKRDPASFVQKTGGGVEPQMVSLVKPNPVSSQPLSLAQIIQQEVGVCDTSTTSSCTQSTSMHMSELGILESLLSISSQHSLSDDAKLSSKTATSSSFTSKGQHFHSPPREPSLSRGLDHRKIDSHAIASMMELSSNFASSTTATLNNFKSAIAFQCSTSDVAVLKKANFHLTSLVMTQSGVSLSQQRLRLCVHGKLKKSYSQKLFQNFDFSGRSPDDEVQEKQRDVFFRN